jgi:hypothetical protein
VLLPVLTDVLTVRQLSSKRYSLSLVQIADSGAYISGQMVLAVSHHTFHKIGVTIVPSLISGQAR